MCKMLWKLFSLIILLTFNIIVVQGNEICDQNCTCTRFTNTLDSLPNTLANCRGSNFKIFPTLSTSTSHTINILDLSVNQLNSLEFETTTIQSLNLHKLILTLNQIDYIDIDFFDNIPNLHYLDLSHNNITNFDDNEVFVKLTKLRYLDLSYNKIKTLPDKIFISLIHLNYLDLSYNSATLKNSLSTLQQLPNNLTHLKLDSLSITDLPNSFFDPYTNLKTLSLADNNFKLIPNLPYSIEFLDFSGNNLSYVSAKYLNYHSLKTLKLNRMLNLNSIHHYAFYNLQSLEKLVINDCPQLTEFTELAFGVAAKSMDYHPKYLSLARNSLTTLNETYKFLFRKMHHIDLRHNSWSCDCDILWLEEFKEELYRSYDIRCASPKRLKNRSVTSLTEDSLQHCHPEVYGKTSHRILIVVLVGAVIILIGIIFYLVRYPNMWLTQASSGIGPGSPYYNPAPTNG